MKKLIFITILISLVNAEPSAFLAGDLDSSNPYGLTKDEKYIWQNKQNIKKLNTIIQAQQQLIKQQTKTLNKLKLQFLNYKMKTDNLAQQIDGINSILPLYDKINSDIVNLKQDINSTNIVLFNLKDEVEKLKNIVTTNRKIDENNTKMILNLVEKLATNIDKLQKSKETNSVQQLPNSKLLSKAVVEFNKSYLTKAKEKFIYLYNKKYKLNIVNFYLGEIAYKKGDYKTALAYYKQAIKTGKVPSYLMDDLLYHTGYSFERLHKYDVAKKSYLKLIQTYPKSILVKYAKKRVENLEKKK